MLRRFPYASRRAAVCRTPQRFWKRYCLLVVAAAAFAPDALLPLPAGAQTADWQMYQRADLGFEVEMPGKPKLREEKSETGLVTIEAELTFGSMVFGARYYTGPQKITVQD